MSIEARPGAIVSERYALRRVLGRGGMCTVWEALHRYTGRRVAVKLLNPDFAEHPEARERLLREALALGGVRHPNVVEVHDAGEWDGDVYVVTELLEGRSVEGLVIARGRLGFADSAEVARQVALALAASHAAGVVHRDVKSSNVLIVKRGDGREVAQLLDYGIAHLSPQWYQRERITMIGSLLGTPAYMAPEQLLGQTLTPRSDVYALGVMLYECLTGDVPFSGSVEETVTFVAHHAVAPIQTRAPDVPDALAAVVDRCLRRDPDARVQSAQALAHTLERTGLTGQRLQLLQSIAPSADELTDVATAVDRRARQAQPQGESSRPTPPLPLAARRQRPRAPYHAPARMVSPAGTLDGRTEDISEGGVLVLAPQELPVGETVQLRFALPVSGSVVTCAAVVRWARTRAAPAQTRAAMGLEFVQPSSEVRTVIGQYLELMGRA
ncbi:MAG: serine/threonine-protein kinase [Polyangiales bacterium]